MILDEFYSLYALTLTQNKRVINLYFKNNNFTVSYFYNGEQQGIKLISIERLWKFMNKYRDFKTKGYNRPSVCSKTFDTKTGKEI